MVANFPSTFCLFIGDRLGQIKKAKTTRLAAFDLRRAINRHDNSQFVFCLKNAAIRRICLVDNEADLYSCCFCTFHDN